MVLLMRFLYNCWTYQIHTCMYVHTHSFQVRNFRLIFSNPASCSPSECGIYVGILNSTTNPGSLEIYMEGDAQGWVAVGFSDSQNMVKVNTVFLLKIRHENNIA